MLERAANVLRDLVLTTPPNAGGGIFELIKPGPSVGAFSTLARRPAASRRLFTRALPTSSTAGLRATWSRRIRVRRHRRNVCGAVDAGHGLRAAAPLLRRGERQARALGPRHRRHGRHHAARWLRRPLPAVPSSAPTRRSSRAGDGERANGVVLTSGETIAARAVAANVGPKLLFRDLVAEAELGATRAISGIKTGSGTFRMNVALAELPDFTCRPGKDVRPSPLRHRHRSDARLSRARLSRRRAEGWSREPVVEMLIPSTLDATLAPPGKHVASLFVQHVAPHLPDGRSWADARRKRRSPISSSTR